MSFNPSKLEAKLAAFHERVERRKQLRKISSAQIEAAKRNMQALTEKRRAVMCKCGACNACRRREASRRYRIRESDRGTPMEQGTLGEYSNFEIALADATLGPRNVRIPSPVPKINRVLMINRLGHIESLSMP